MRIHLQALEGKRAKFIATFARKSTFKTKFEPREKVLLKKLCDSQYNLLADHVSISDFSSLCQMESLQEGDIIVFSARVQEYVRGYHGEDIDLRINYPHAIDYGLCDIRDVRKQNLAISNKTVRKDGEFENLMRNKRIVLGIVEN